MLRKRNAGSIQKIAESLHSLHFTVPTSKKAHGSKAFVDSWPPMEIGRKWNKSIERFEKSTT